MIVLDYVSYFFWNPLVWPPSVFRETRSAEAQVSTFVILGRSWYFARALQVSPRL